MEEQTGGRLAIGVIDIVLDVDLPIANDCRFGKMVVALTNLARNYRVCIERKPGVPEFVHRRYSRHLLLVPRSQI